MSKFFLITILLTTTIFYLPFAQNCNGDNFFSYGDFGTGVDNIGALPNGFPNVPIQYVATPPPNGDDNNGLGQFTISNKVLKAWGFQAAPFWIEVEDNSPNADGYMMVIDAANNDNVVVWQEQVELCGSSVYEFSVDVANIFDPNNGAPSIYEPNLNLRINGQVIENYDNGVIPRDGQWHSYITTINPPNGTGTYTIDLYHISENDGTRIFGGDFAIDNLSLKRCEPQLVLPSNVIVCQPNETRLNAAVNNMVFNNPVYQWQKSTDNGSSWQTVPSSNTTSLLVDDPSNGDQYRIVVAQDASLLNNNICQVLSNTTTLDVRVTKATIDRTICEGTQTQIGNQTFEVAGSYTDIRLTNEMGCDSLVTLNLTVLPNQTAFIEQSICDGETYNFFGSTLTTAGTYQNMIAAQNGCDSVITLELSVRESIETMLNASICEGETYSFEGQILSASDIYTVTYQTESGCDSTITLDLTVLEHTAGTRNIELCEGELFEGISYTESTTFENILQNEVGCDSTLTTNITVYPIYENIIPTQICEGETFMDALINSDTTIVLNQTSINGCDSISYFEVEILRPVVVNLERQICTGELFFFGGEARTASNQYVEVLTGLNGCDSITVLNLQVLESIDINQAASICEGETYSFGGQTLVEAGIYIDSLLTLTGCDSIVKLDLTVLNNSLNVIDVTVCAGTPYLGQIYTESTFLTDRLVSANGCDSILTTNINVLPVYEQRELVTLCSGDFFIDRQQFSDTTFSVNYQSSLGCDSLVQYEILVEDLSGFEIEGDLSLCPNESSALSAGDFVSYEWNNGASTPTVEITNTGWYAVTVTSDIGCIASDSVLVEVTALSAQLIGQQPSCFGTSNGRIEVINVEGGTPPYSYRIGNVTQSSGNFSGLVAGNYQVQITDAAGCALDLSYDLQEPDLLVVNLVETVELTLGQSVQLAATANRAVKYNWSPASILSCTNCPNPVANPLNSQDIIVTATDSMGCEATSQVALIVGNYQLYAPTAFSPNGDGVNDMFQIFPENGSIAQVNHFSIYDRWGNQLLEKKQPAIKALNWDGTANNQSINPGVYTWLLSFELIDGRKEVLSGTVLVQL